MAEAEAIASNSSNPRGRLRINASVTFGVRFLAPLWPTFMDKYPEIDLDVVLNDETVDLVKGGYDMAVRISRAGSEDYVARKLMTSQDVVCASPAYLRRNGEPKAPVDSASIYALDTTMRRRPKSGDLPMRRGIRTS